jgi:hypothetical protein
VAKAEERLPRKEVMMLSNLRRASPGVGRIRLSQSTQYGRRRLSWCGNSPEQKAAIRAYKAALIGDVEPETARGVFIAFARKGHSHGGRH